MKQIQLWVDRPNNERPKVVAIGTTPKAWQRGEPTGRLVLVTANTREQAERTYLRYQRAVALGGAQGVVKLAGTEDAEIGPLLRALQNVEEVTRG